MRNQYSNYRTVTLEDFLNVAGINKKTFLTRYKNIPGITKKNDGFVILEGTRIPYNVRHNKFKTEGDRRYVLLKAINERKYIDCKILKVFPTEFKSMINDLLKIDFIKENQMCNRFGANGFTITDKGANQLKSSRRETIEFVAKLIAECSGIVAKNIISGIVK